MGRTSLKGISLAIKTINRPKNYIRKVISQLPKNMPIRVIVGSPDYKYLECYRRSSCIEVVGIDPAEWERYKNYPIQHRSSWNYWRCFTYGVRSTGGKGLLVLEDDVVPAIGWENRLEKTIKEIESQFGDEYVLALFTHQTRLAKAEAGIYYRRYPASRFAGSQAMFYPESVRASFTDYLAKEGRDSFRMGYDLLLGEFLRYTGIPLFATAPCLFQHIGDVGTGGWGVVDNSWVCLRAGHFVQNLPKESFNK
jgi:hypothetical protein